MFLLRETDRTVTDVCFDVGYTSLAHSGRSSARHQVLIALGTAQSWRRTASSSPPYGLEAPFEDGAVEQFWISLLK